ncbi:MAG: GEVED domain-containing protein, partial [Gemmatimonas sp.]
MTIPVSVLNNTGSLAYLHSWIDLNNDGVFANAVIGSGGERLVAAQSINTSGTAQAINVTFTVPTGIAAGSTVGARFRLTSDIATTPTVVAGIGETEDYV